jgi:hypothetical protein
MICTAGHPHSHKDREVWLCVGNCRCGALRRTLMANGSPVSMFSAYFTFAYVPCCVQEKDSIFLATQLGEGSRMAQRQTDPGVLEDNYTPLPASFPGHSPQLSCLKPCDANLLPLSGAQLPSQSGDGSPRKTPYSHFEPRCCCKTRSKSLSSVGSSGALVRRCEGCINWYRNLSTQKTRRVDTAPGQRSGCRPVALAC